MYYQVVKRLFCIAALTCSGMYAQAQHTAVKEPKDVPAEWSKAYAPFRMAGDLYYVGTADLAVYLITTKAGNILINTGLAGSLPMIKRNIEALGFKFKDTKILLTMQAHYDHMGAMAAIQKMTGAKFMVDEKEEDVVKSGGATDYAIGGGVSTYQPVKIDRLLHNGDTIHLGDMNLVMLHHPGHTQGSCSFLFDTRDSSRSYRVLLANMPTIVTEKHFHEVHEYPGIAKDYAYTLQSLSGLQFDVWAAAHASQFDLAEKHHPGDAYNPAVFKDRAGFDKELAELKAKYEQKMAEEE
ncbi:metallo-beta-lactamase class B [Chitinophaga dinghuensis]|uniref:Metallo-beta-lactamase class B n=1 Tax=Chitinophaga dinghuensis TaxID=1539050 RepID=A0A327WHS6_9BACT|nr:subclass B3 metallo-beta-lactamase [Chitinophaga dinghuensis]RAJ87284.1 metallo-beta-lactamase class B [Chitinophaga dinghuensis]